MCKEANKNKSVMSIDLVIGGYHGMVSCREIIKINAKLTSGINITRIFRLAHF